MVTQCLLLPHQQALRKVVVCAQGCCLFKTISSSSASNAPSYFLAAHGEERVDHDSPAHSSGWGEGGGTASIGMVCIMYVSSLVPQGAFHSQVRICLLMPEAHTKQERLWTTTEPRSACVTRTIPWMLGLIQ